MAQQAPNRCAKNLVPYVPCPVTRSFCSSASLRVLRVEIKNAGNGRAAVKDGDRKPHAAAGRTVRSMTVPFFNWALRNS